jgi:hypothetical protein
MYRYYVVGICALFTMTPGSLRAQTDAPSKPTLAQTLEWLSEKIPRAGTESSRARDHRHIWDYSETIRFGADGCQVTVETRNEMQREDDEDGDSKYFWVQTMRIPLAAVQLDSIKIEETPNPAVGELLNGPPSAYGLNFRTDGKVVAYKQDANNPDIVIQNRLIDKVGILFYDEALSQRIMTAFKYAVMYCRAQKASKPEPF